MDHFTKEEIKQLLENDALVKRLTGFVTMGGAAYFEEVRASLSPKELEEYLKENPDERIYLDKK